MEYNNLFEVINEYEVIVPGLNFKVKGKVLKDILTDNENSRYIGKLSHYCKFFEDAADVYIPNGLFGSDFNDVAELIISYLKKFRNIEVKKSDCY